MKEIYTFKEKKPITLGGVETEAFVVQTLSQGARSNEELLSDARPLVGQGRRHGNAHGEGGRSPRSSTRTSI